MTENFYNTINLTARELFDAQISALNQEQRIMRYFLKLGSAGSAAPSAVQEKVFEKAVPITSVRRAITNLTKSGDLLKLGTMITGPFGQPEHLWTVAAKWNASTPRQGELL
jgi:hypothetical protein